MKRRQFIELSLGDSAATGTGPKAWQFERTWKMVIPLKTVT